MRASPFVFFALLIAASGAIAIADSVTTVSSGQEAWKAQPDKSSMAVVYGDPSKPGFYVIRLKVPANWVAPPHYHPGRENVTILSGTVYFGVGNTIDKSKATAFGAGSFASIPAKTPHYAYTTSSGAEIQLDGIGPFGEVPIKQK